MSANGQSRRRSAAVLSLLMLVIAAACGTTDAGEPSRDAASRTLRLAHIDGGTALDPGVEWFAERVEELSDGALEIDVVLDCCGVEADAEEQLVAAVRDGEFDLGWVGTRVFEQLGVPELTALTAPLLLDSYGAQQAVLEDDVTSDMLAALGELDVEGLALVPGALRHPIADRPLRSPDSWQGVALHVFRSGVATAAVEALGATAVDAGFPDRDAGLEDGTIQGMENSVSFHNRRTYATSPYLTLNVGLWPRTSALIANEQIAAELDEAELDWLRTAAADVVARTGELAAIDADAVARTCEIGGRFTAVTPAELAELEESFATVHAEIEQAGGLLDRVRAVAEQATADDTLEIPEGCDESSPPGVTSTWDGPTIPDGSYTKVIAKSDAIADGVPEEFLDQPGEFPHTDELRIILRFEGDRYTLLANYEDGDDVGDRGAIEYDDQGRLVAKSTEGGYLVLAWTIDDGTLTLDPADDAGDYADLPPEDQAITRLFGTGTFERDGADLASGERIPAGSYEKTATREEALAEGVPAEVLDRPDEFRGIDELHITHTFYEDGRFEQSANYVEGTSVGDRGRYEHDADGRLVKNHDTGDVTVLDWSFTDGVLTLEVDPDGGNYAERSEVDQAIARFYDAGVYQQVE